LDYPSEGVNARKVGVVGVAFLEYSFLNVAEPPAAQRVY
jgi:hypothetical protein